jgi:hypothetical protein
VRFYRDNDVERRFAPGQPQADLAQQVQMRHLAKQYGHELFPTSKPVGPELGLILLDELCEPSACLQMSWLVLFPPNVVLSGNPLQSNGDQQFRASVCREELPAILDSNDVILFIFRSR